MRRGLVSTHIPEDAAERVSSSAGACCPADRRRPAGRDAAVRAGPAAAGRACRMESGSDCSGWDCYSGPFVLPFSRAFDDLAIPVTDGTHRNAPARKSTRCARLRSGRAPIGQWNPTTHCEFHSHLFQGLRRCDDGTLFSAVDAWHSAADPGADLDVRRPQLIATSRQNLLKTGVPSIGRRSFISISRCPSDNPYPAPHPSLARGLRQTAYE